MPKKQRILERSAKEKERTIKQKLKILTSLTGEFFVASKLCQMGYFASLTLKNYPETDIFVLGKNGKQVAIQVKTQREEHTGNKLLWVPEKIEETKNPFVYVWIKKDERIECYIIPAKDLAKISKKIREDYIASRPNVSKDQLRMIGLENLQPFKDRWDLLGLD
jgi:hypothetical protein